MARPRTKLAVCLMLPALLWAGSAQAFVRTTVQNNPDVPLYWQQRTISISPAYDTCEDVAPNVVRTAILESMQSWKVAGDGCSDINLLEGRGVSGMATNLFGAQPDGENRIVWRELNWPQESEDALAITTIVYDKASGQILDADIDMNGVNFFWTVTNEAGEVVTDVENTMTHELGHLLGMAHSPETEATMYGSSDPGETAKRSLAVDDVNAICTVYPYGLPTPRGTEIIQGALTSGTSCAISQGAVLRSAALASASPGSASPGSAPPRGHGASGGLNGVGLLGLVAVAARSRRRRR